jgi:Holliday junction DNA helicase RuvA
MIAGLKGLIKDVFTNFIILETADGVGYRVEGLPVESKIQGNELDIYIFTHYTQQEVRLFGFLTKGSFLLFQDLITVSGVGPKSAVALLNNVGVDNIKFAIIEKDHKSLMGNGVGLKIAQKIVIELADKYNKEALDPNQKIITKGNKVLEEVSLALEGLGYSKREIDSAIVDLGNDFSSLPFEKIFRNCLNYLKKRN